MPLVKPTIGETNWGGKLNTALDYLNTDTTSLLNLSNNIVPTVTNTLTLGTATKRFASIYLGPGTLNITDSVLNTNAAISVANGVFQIGGIAQAQLPNIRVTNLTFNDNTVQTTAFAPTPTSFNPQFTDASGTVAGVTATGSYTLVGKLCFFRVYVNFSGYTNLGTGGYKITLPFASVSTMTQRGGTLHNTTTSSLYHIAGITEVSAPTVMNFYYSGSTTDLVFKYNTPVSAIDTSTHFDISGIYEVA